MNRALLLSLFLLSAAAPAYAQGGNIWISSDQTPWNEYIVDEGGLLQLTIWHVHTTGSTASEWKLDVSNVAWTHLGDTPDFNLVIGSSVAGVSIAYEACLSGEFKLMTVNFFSVTPAPTCTEIFVVAAPGKTGVRGVDCDENSYLIPNDRAIVNPDQTCLFPVEKSTWGQIKALYR
jgi:hypothetical protein